MLIVRFSFCVLFISVFTALAGAQDVPEPSKPTAGHELLKKFVGEWEVQSGMEGQPGQPAMTSKGLMKSRMLGDLWVISELDCDMSGTRMNAVQTIGFNEDKGKYVGTWVDSVMNLMWIYEGFVEDNGAKLILEAEGPDFSTGKTTKFRDAYVFKSADLIESTSSMMTADGKWVTFMTGSMKRKK